MDFEEAQEVAGEERLWVGGVISSQAYFSLGVRVERAMFGIIRKPLKTIAAKNGRMRALTLWMMFLRIRIG